MSEEATYWLFEIETTDDVEGILPVFDAWLQESAANRAAYAAARRYWLNAVGAQIGQPSRLRNVPVQCVREGYGQKFSREEWRLLYLIAAGILSIAVMLTNVTGRASDGKPTANLYR